jgi:tetratricopeptide (TPR) repeat protein
MNIYDFAGQEKYDSLTLELIEKHPERVSERDRLWIVQNYYYWQRPEPEWGKSLEAGRQLLALYPDDFRATYNTGVVYGAMEEWDEAQKYHERGVSAGDRFVAAFGSLAGVFRAKGEPAKAQEVLERYLREVENTGEGHRNLAYHHITQNRLDLAARELEAAETLVPGDYESRVLRGNLLLLSGEFSAAEEAYRSLLEEEVPAASYGGYVGLFDLLLLEGRYQEIIAAWVPLAERFRRSGVAYPEWACHNALALTYLRSGWPEVALDECRKAYAIDTGDTDFGNKRSVIHLRGLIHLASNRIDEAEKTAGELKALIERGLNRKEIRLYDHLMGAVEMERNNMPRALEYLEKAVQSLPYGAYQKDASFIDTLAEAYMKAGDLTKAREQYEKITALTTGRLSHGDIYARSFYHLGRIDEKLGDKAKARENYTKFLDLWKNADPGLPEPADAKKRLAAL